MEFVNGLYALILGAITIPLIVIVYFFIENTASIKFSSVKLFDNVKISFRTVFRHIPFALFLLAYVSLLIAFSRPRIGDELAVDYTKGIAIQMVLDRSSSMSSERIRKGGDVITYFDIAKIVAKDFIVGNTEGLEGRNSDMIGFSSFAKYVQENCPLTLDHDNLTRIIDAVNPAIPNSIEDGTAIGEAIYHSVLTLVSIDDFLKESRDTDDKENYEIKSKIIILLTDGINRFGRDIEEAAEYAVKNDIKLYSIFMANRQTKMRIEMREPSIMRNIGDLQNASENTGGKLYLAFDTESLRDVYSDIDQLEKSELGEVYYRYKEIYHYFLLAGFVLLLLEMLLANTVFRRIP